MERDDILSLLDSGELRHFGPDLNILNYVCNPRNEDGSINQNLDCLNRFNLAVYEQCHVPVSRAGTKKLPVPLEEFPQLFITMTRLHTAEYDGPFLDMFLKRIFNSGYSSEDLSTNGLVCLRSVVMDPFMPFAESGDFFRTITSQLGAVLDSLVVRRSTTR
ncbi:hypothetical protein [Desulfogranum japonicum]|uniref:hypothetical protein n=1 Tax=Desulfogranum japonicum TaxID=231447 RepID=UPI00041FA1B7|nr:hypothetical protein [Desulfogranum japonicum]